MQSFEQDEDNRSKRMRRNQIARRSTKMIVKSEIEPEISYLQADNICRTF